MINHYNNSITQYHGSFSVGVTMFFHTVSVSFFGGSTHVRIDIKKMKEDGLFLPEIPIYNDWPNIPNDEKETVLAFAKKVIEEYFATNQA